MKIMTMALGAAMAAGLLAGCVPDAQMQAQQLEADRSQCAGLGFPSGSTAMANCMNTASNRRAEREAREAADDRRWSEEYDRKEAAKKQARAIAAVPPMTEPTITRIPGGDPATANMSMCSDGGLREDCADAPNGY